MEEENPQEVEGEDSGSAQKKKSRRFPPGSAERGSDSGDTGGEDETTGKDEEVTQLSKRPKVDPTAEDEGVPFRKPPGKDLTAGVASPAEPGASGEKTLQAECSGSAKAEGTCPASAKRERAAEAAAMSTDEGCEDSSKNGGDGKVASSVESGGAEGGRLDSQHPRKASMGTDSVADSGEPKMKTLDSSSSLGSTSLRYSASSEGSDDLADNDGSKEKSGCKGKSSAKGKAGAKGKSRSKRKASAKGKCGAKGKSKAGVQGSSSTTSSGSDSETEESESEEAEGPGWIPPRFLKRSKSMEQTPSTSSFVQPDDSLSTRHMSSEALSLPGEGNPFSDPVSTQYNPAYTSPGKSADAPPLVPSRSSSRLAVLSAKIKASSSPNLSETRAGPFKSTCSAEMATPSKCSGTAGSCLASCWKCHESPPTDSVFPIPPSTPHLSGQPDQVALPSTSQEAGRKGDDSATAKRKGDDSATAKPKGDDSVTAKPKGHDSATAKPKGDDSATAKPKGKDSARAKPKGDDSATAKPKGDDSATAKPKGDDSATAKPKGKDSARAKPKGDDSATAKPKGDDSATAKPKGHDSARARAEGDDSARARLEGDDSARARLEGDDSARARLEGDDSARARAEGDDSARARLEGDDSARAEREEEDSAGGNRTRESLTEKKLKLEAENLRQELLSDMFKKIDKMHPYDVNDIMLILEKLTLREITEIMETDEIMERTVAKMARDLRRQDH